MGKLKPIHPTRKLKEPEELLSLWNEFKAWKKQQAKVVPAVNQRSGEVINVLHELPLTTDSFCVWSVNYKGWGIGSLENYIENLGNLYDNFKGVVTHIRKEAKIDRFDGAAVGQFKEGLINRFDGYSDKQENTIKAEPRIFNV
jgi:hypothetical protein